MRKLLMGTIVVFVLGLAGSASAFPITVLVGDKDNFGNMCTSDVGGPGTCSYDGMPYNMTDHRSAAEKLAANGAQFTDEYDALGFGPTADNTINFLMPFNGTLTSATLTSPIADLQCNEFGALSYSINGLGPTTFCHEDGFTATNVYTFSLSAAQIAAANLAHQVVLTFARGAAGDYVAFDWVQLNAEAVPEPASLLLLGTGLLGGLRAFRKRTR